MALSTYPPADASVRQRFLAYVPALQRAGWDVQFETILSAELFRRKNHSGRLRGVDKAARLAVGLARRLIVLGTARRFDAVWIHREAFPFFTPWAERAVSRLVRGPVVLDFDDAIYEAPPSGRDWRSRLRRTDRFHEAVAAADRVLVGSPELRRWALRHGIEAELIPTCVDTRILQPVASPTGRPITIGWMGSWSTAGYLDEVAGVLRALAARPGVAVQLVGSANLATIQAGIPGARWEPWSADREAEQLAAFDIGIMPVPDTPWNRGKCAYKLIQYMAVGIPFVASPVGMNVSVAEGSGAGLLCETEDQWREALNRLVDDPNLRHTLGVAGRAYAVQHYDQSGYEPRILAALELGPIGE